MLEDLAKNVLDEVVVVVKDAHEVFSSRVAKLKLACCVFESAQMSTNDGPKALFKPLSQEELIAKLLEALAVEYFQGAFTLAHFLLGRSFRRRHCPVALLTSDPQRQPICEKFFDHSQFVDHIVFNQRQLIY